MAKHLNVGESIECNKSRIAVRSVSKNPTLVAIEGLNGKSYRFFKYKTKIRAIATIIEELNPKECVICEGSHLDLDDTLEAETLEIYTSKRMIFEVISNFSNVHGIQGDEVNHLTYAKIIIPWRFLLEKNLLN
jgi:hypothetical protein